MLGKYRGNPLHPSKVAASMTERHTMKALMAITVGVWLWSGSSPGHLSGTTSDVPDEWVLASALMASPLIIAGRVEGVAREFVPAKNADLELLKVRVDHQIKGNVPEAIRIVIAEELMAEVNGVRSAHRFESLKGRRLVCFLERMAGEAEVFTLRNVHPLALGLTMLPVGDLPSELQQSATWPGRVELEALSAMRSADEYVVRIGIELLYFLETPSEHATAAARRLLRSGSPSVQHAAERYFDRIARDRRATESSGIETK